MYIIIFYIVTFYCSPALFWAGGATDFWHHRGTEAEIQGTVADIQLPMKRFPDSSVSFLIRPNWSVWKGIPPPNTCSNTHGWITGDFSSSGRV